MGGIAALRAFGKAEEILRIGKRFIPLSPSVNSGPSPRCSHGDRGVAPRQTQDRANYTNTRKSFSGRWVYSH